MIDTTRPIHVTERSIYRSCRRKWYYQFIERLDVQNQYAQSDALFLGSGGHKALEKWYTQLRDGAEQTPLFETWMGFVQEHGIVVPPDDNDMMIEVLNNYQQYSIINDRNWRIVEIEKRFTLDLPGIPVKLTGAFDLIIEDLEHGGLWIVDHKFLGRMPDPKHLEMDDQMTAYIWICHRVGIPVRGVIYNVIKKKAPTLPLILKNGTVSQNKLQDTTLELYKAAIDSIGGDYADYISMLTFLENKPNNFIQRHEVTRNKHELNGFYDLLMMEITEMSDSKTFIYPNPGYTCQWCKFQTLCKCQSEQGDTEMTKKLMYRVKEDYER